MQRSLATAGNAKLAINVVITIALAGLIASTTYAVSQINLKISLKLLNLLYPNFFLP